MGADVHGATLGIIGLGRIGQAIARRAQGFGMRVLYHNRKRDPEAERPRRRVPTKADLLREADFVVLSVPLSAGDPACDRRRGARAHEAHGLPGERRAGPGGRRGRAGRGAPGAGGSRAPGSTSSRRSRRSIPASSGSRTSRSRPTSARRRGRRGSGWRPAPRRTASPRSKATGRRTWSTRRRGARREARQARAPPC